MTAAGFKGHRGESWLVIRRGQTWLWLARELSSRIRVDFDCKDTNGVCSSDSWIGINQNTQTTTAITPVHTNKRQYTYAHEQTAIHTCTQTTPKQVRTYTTAPTHRTYANKGKHSCTQTKKNAHTHVNKREHSPTACKQPQFTLPQTAEIQVHANGNTDTHTNTTTTNLSPIILFPSYLLFVSP